MLITGATGFIGSRLVAALRSGGEEVVALEAGECGWAARKPTRSGASATRAKLGTLAAGATIVHLADGLSRYEGQQISFDRAQTAHVLKPSLELARQAREAGVAKLIYASSIRAMAGESCPNELSEADEPRPVCLYGRLKLAAERELADILLGSSVGLVALRLPIVYGTGRAGNFSRLLCLADSPFPLPLGGLTNARSMLFIENLASAVAAIHRHDASASGAYLVHDGRALSTDELVRLLRRALGRPARLFSLPAIAWSGLEGIRALRPVVGRLVQSLAVDDERFRKEFNWQPPVSVEVALEQAACTYAVARVSSDGKR